MSLTSTRYICGTNETGTLLAHSLHDNSLTSLQDGFLFDLISVGVPMLEQERAARSRWRMEG